jgi:hypothetical protein
MDKLTIFESEPATAKLAREWWHVTWRVRCVRGGQVVWVQLPIPLSKAIATELKTEGLTAETRASVEAIVREQLNRTSAASGPKDSGQVGRPVAPGDAGSTGVRSPWIPQYSTARSEPNTTTQDKGDSTAPLRVAIRWIAAIGTAIALIAILSSTIEASDEELSSFEPSAVRLAQIFTEGAFYSVTAIGFLLCAYIFSRWD